MNPNSKLVSKVDITNNRILYTVGKVPQPSGPTQSPTNFGLGKKFMFQINSLATNDPTAKSNKIEGSCGTNQFNLALEHSSRNVVLITGKAEKALAGQFPQRAVIGSIFGQHAPGFSKTTLDPRLYLNVNTPFSALICGIQGSGIPATKFETKQGIILRKFKKFSTSTMKAVISTRSLQTTIRLSNIRRTFSSTTSQLNETPAKGGVSPHKISILKRQAVANADASYESLPPMTSGFDKLTIKDPKSFLRPRIHFSSLPKLALKLTRPAKETEAYGINFGVLPRSDPLPEENQTVTDPSNQHQPTSLIDQALRSRPIGPQKLIHDSMTTSTEEDDSARKKWKTEFGTTNRDPACHNACSDLLVVSHKKLQKLADLINRHRMSVDQALIQMRFSHKAIAAKVLTVLLKAKQEAIERGFKSDRLVIAEAWVTKGFHTSELQVRARGRHGRMSHPTAKFNLVLRQSIDANKLALQRRLALKEANRRLTQRGTIAGSPIRLPADGVIPTSIAHRPFWGW
ncbi:hypothetical protein MJO28_017509 [Puccinia striiformis f. sp. tritici]|nr:hypothetical protein MJO28_017509 [Puccinia striiformis f. sp. tritici]